MSRARVQIDVAAIEHNAWSVVGLCASHGIEVMGVTKGVLGQPEVAEAMVRGGVASIGDSRLDNIVRLRSAGIDVPLALLRAPAIAEIEAAVELVDVSFQTELATIERLADAARATRRVHDVVVMVDLGERREGVLPSSLVTFTREVMALKGVRLVGIGTNLTCLSGLEPTNSNMTELVDLADRVRRDADLAFSLISGGSSSALALVASGGMPGGISQLRIGEAILLGRETVHHRSWTGTVQDAVTLWAEVVEVKDKPPAPPGHRSDRAFRRVPAPSVEGGRRALVALGRADVDVEGLTPLAEGHRIRGATSDYVVVDVSDGVGTVRVGDELGFGPDYGALVTATGSVGLETRIVSANRAFR